jgi:hypothetical protein
MVGKRPLPSIDARTSGAAAGHPAPATPGKVSLVQQLAEVGSDGGAATNHDRVHAAAAHGVTAPSQELPYRDRIQAAFGRHDISGVRAHIGGAAAEGAAAMGAAAYATGNRVAFASTPDLHTAAHEAAHVVQQAGGGVQLKGGVGTAGDAYERHADAIADCVVRGTSAEALLDEHAGAGMSGGRGVQHRWVQRWDQNGPYTGNRPDPTSSTGAGYAIRSSASRVMRVGDTVEYHIEQPQGATGNLGVRWQVINDPTAVAAGHVSATLDGPANQPRWGGLRARVPGIHTIKAWVSVGGQQVAEITYQQQVVASGGGPVQVPANTAASPLTTMRDLIALVRRIETAYGGRPWQDMVSRIRKEYYPGPGGGPYAGVIASFTWDDLIDEQEGQPGLEVPPVAMADVAAIRQHQVVSTDGGERIDIGHILTGVDSFNFPGVAGVFANQGMEGPAAATWSGDVGSALVNWATEATLGDDSEATKVRFYDRFANRSDMLGDVDALAVAHGPNLSLPPSAPLSQRLEAYYQTAPATGQSQRFHNFCRASHFNLSGNQLDPAARIRIRDQIVRFARGFNVKGSALSGIILGGGGGQGAIESTPMARVEREAGWFADHFMAWVNAGLVAEGTH